MICGIPATDLAQLMQLVVIVALLFGLTRAGIEEIVYTVADRIRRKRRAVRAARIVEGL